MKKKHRKERRQEGSNSSRNRRKERKRDRGRKRGVDTESGDRKIDLRKMISKTPRNDDITSRIIKKNIADN